MTSLLSFIASKELYHGSFGQATYVVYWSRENGLWIKVEGDIEENGDFGNYSELISNEEFYELTGWDINED